MVLFVLIYLSIPELPIMEQWDQHEIYEKVQQEPSEYQGKGKFLLILT
jgi:hypothetical protein